MGGAATKQDGAGAPAGRLEPEPIVTLVNAFTQPYNNAIATARTCYAARIITPADVDKDEPARAQRDRIADSTYQAGHHTTLQHATFQFTLDNVSRQLLWSFLHAHPYYNSEQVSQRYVAVKRGRYAVPPLAPRDRELYDETVALQHRTYESLIALLVPVVEREYGRVFPARAKRPERWKSAIKKRAMEVARYVLPVATHAHLYHTVSGITLHRYHRLLAQIDCPLEARIVIEAMIDCVNQIDPLFFARAEDPLPLEDTVEHRLLTELAGGGGGGGGLVDAARAKRFIAAFDAELGARVSVLVDYPVAAERTLARAVRAVLGVPDAAEDGGGEGDGGGADAAGAPVRALLDAEALDLVLHPRSNRYFGEALNLTTLSKLGRTLHHPHYTFRKKLSHTADSQDQRHRMVPASRPALVAHHVPGEPDVVLPPLVAACPPARAEYEACMETVWRAMKTLWSNGVAPADFLYLLPNAVAIRFDESGDLANLRHKWTTRLCYNAQEEIWRAAVEEVQQLRAVHPRLGEYMLPPCTTRLLGGKTPYCPEGDKYCGVPVWKIALDDYQRLL
jgi:thymidylate synthase ThyX